MKQSFYFITCIILALALNACSDKMDDPVCFDFDEFLATYQNVCTLVTDAIEYPDFWWNPNNPFVPSDETLRSTSTCGLLVTLQKYTGMWYPAVGSLNAPIISMYNNYLRECKVAVEFFKRGDFYPVLVSEYLSVIKKNFEWGGRAADSPHYIQWLLASDMSMSVMSKKEKIQLMVMALERTKYALDMESQEPCLIMIAIMKSCKYAPFMEDIEPRLVETCVGYTMIEPGFKPVFFESIGYTWVKLEGPGFTANFLTSDHREIIIKCAKQFLNEQK